MLINANKVLKSPSAVKSLEQLKRLEAVVEVIFQEARAERGRFCKVKLDDTHSCSVVAPKLMGKRRV